VELKANETISLEADFFSLCNFRPSVNWSSSDTSVARVSASGIVTAISEGECTVSVATENGDYTAECQDTVKTRTTAVNEISVIPFQAYINSSNKLIIHFKEPVQLVDISIFDTSGTKVLTRKNPKNFFSLQQELDVSDLAGGIYFLAITSMDKNGNPEIFKKVVLFFQFNICSRS
jgi:hypothetical protein